MSKYKEIKQISRATAKALEKKHIFLNASGSLPAMVFDSADEELNFRSELHNADTRKMTLDADPFFNAPNDAVLAYQTSAYLNTFIHQVTQKLAFNELATDLQQGDFATENFIVPTIARQGYTSQYDDYTIDGRSGFTPNFPNRNVYRLQTTVEYGDLEVATWAAAKIDAISEKREAAAEIIAQDINTICFYGLQQFNGIVGKKTYGILSDPNLNATIASPGIFSGLTANQIYSFMQYLFQSIVLVSANRVRINRDQEIILAMTPFTEIWFTTPNSLFTGTPLEFLRQHLFPKLKIVTAIQYQVGNGLTGNLLQMIIPKIGIQDTIRNLFTYKFRAHRVEVKSTYVQQVFSASTAGELLALPFAVATATGV